VYHLELRQFPHVVRRFNLTEPELLVLAVPWAKEEWVEFGERKWNANQAKLAILEGPQLSLQQLAMGRGWRNAQRQSEDVTERVIQTLEAAPAAAAQGAVPGAATWAAPSPSADLQLLADSLGLELLALLDDGPVSLSRAWRVAHERLAERPPAESLALAEQAVRSLLERRLVVLQTLAATPGATGGDAEAGERTVGEEPIEPSLRAIDSWAGGEQSAAVLLRRA
jgi:hypothetical protein